MGRSKLVAYLYRNRLPANVFATPPCDAPAPRKTVTLGRVAISGSCVVGGGVGGAPSVDTDSGEMTSSSTGFRGSSPSTVASPSPYAAEVAGEGPSWVISAEPSTCLFLRCGGRSGIGGRFSCSVVDES